MALFTQSSSHSYQSVSESVSQSFRQLALPHTDPLKARLIRGPSLLVCALDLLLTRPSPPLHKPKPFPPNLDAPPLRSSTASHCMMELIVFEFFCTSFHHCSVWQFSHVREGRLCTACPCLLHHLCVLNCLSQRRPGLCS